LKSLERGLGIGITTGPQKLRKNQRSVRKEIEKVYMFPTQSFLMTPLTMVMAQFPEKYRSKKFALDTEKAPLSAKVYWQNEGQC